MKNLVFIFLIAAVLSIFTSPCFSASIVIDEYTQIKKPIKNTIDSSQKSPDKENKSDSPQSDKKDETTPQDQKGEDLKPIDVIPYNRT